MRCVIIVLALLCFGCKNSQTPKGILELDKMKMVMDEMVQAEAFVTNFVLKDTTKNQKVEMMKLYNTIFTIHKTNSNQFLKSFDYYMQQPNVARAMFDSLQIESRKVNKVMEPITDTSTKAIVDTSNLLTKDTLNKMPLDTTKIDKVIPKVPTRKFNKIKTVAI